MAQIVNIEEAFPGAARVSFNDGSQMTVPKSSLPPQLQLQNSGATAQNMSVDPGMSRTDEAPPVPPPTGPSMTYGSGQSIGPSNAGEFGTKWGSEPVAQPAPVQPATQPAPPQMQAPMSYTQALLAELRSPTKRVPGSPAFDPQKEASRRSPVPVSQTVQSAHARAYDPAALQDAQEKEQKALEMQAEGNMLQANAKLQADRVMHTEVSNLYRQQQAEQAARETDFYSKQQALDDDAKAVAAREIDPNRVFKNMSIFQSLGLAIAAGLKGYATQGRDNSVMDSLMHRMDADIRAQEHDIANSKGRVDNALYRLSQQFGSIQAGKAALKDQQLSVIMAKNTATASEIGTAVAKSNADAANMKLQAEQAKLREQRWSEAQGQTSTTTAAAMMSPRAATAAHDVTKPLAERVKNNASADKIEEDAATREGKQLANLEKRGELTGAIPGKASAEITKYGEDRLKTEGAKELVQRFMDANGIKKGSDGTWQSSKSQMAGIGPSNLWEPGSWQTAEGKKNNADLNQLKAAIAFVMYGASTPEQLETVDKLFLSRTNEEALSAGLGATLEAANSKLRTLDAAYGSKVVQEFERRRATQGKERQATQAGISEPE